MSNTDSESSSVASKRPSKDDQRNKLLLFHLYTDCSLPEPEARVVLDSNVFQGVKTTDALQLIQILADGLGEERAGKLLKQDPTHFRRNIREIESCVGLLVTALSMPSDAAKDCILQCPSIMDVPRKERELLLGKLITLFPNDKLVIRAFVCTHPEYLTLDITHLNDHAFSDVDGIHESMWQAIISQPGCQPRELAPTGTSRPSKPKRAKALQRLTPKTLPPTPPVVSTPKEPEEAVVEVTEAPIKTEAPTHVETPANAELLILETPGLDDSCFQALPEVPPRLEKPICVEDTDRHNVEHLVEVMCRKNVLGINRENAYKFVGVRPWMMEKASYIATMLETLVAARVDPDKLYDFMRKQPGLLLHTLETVRLVLDHLRRHPEIKLPADLGALAIQSKVFLQRLQELDKRRILPRDACYTPALFAPTRREFLKALGFVDRAKLDSSSSA